MVAALVTLLIVPLPTQLLDLLLAANLGLSAVVLASILGGARLVDLAVLPTLLVLTTLLRLALNVSTVRLILARGDAGRVIHAFGAVVVRGDYVIGFAIFLVLTIVQYIVIVRGAERVAEVAARFALDALPGAQLAIDADLRAGAIDPVTAEERRGKLGREAQLYGSLDGAMRFIKGDAIASLLIVAVALVGGLAVGVGERGMSFAQAARLYSLLSIGDALVSQLPALLLSTAAGLIVTRAAAIDAPVGQGLLKLGQPDALAVTAGLVAILALAPGMPFWPFAAVAAGLGAAALARSRRTLDLTATSATTGPLLKPVLELAFNPELASLKAGLRTALDARARRLADDLGLVIPAVQLRADSNVPLRGYRLDLRGLPLGAGTIPDGRLLCEAPPEQLPSTIARSEIEAAHHPATDLPASWVPLSQAPKLSALGLILLDGVGCIAARFESLLRLHAAELVGVDETQELLSANARRYPHLVRDVVPSRVDAPLLTEVLRRLLAEGLSVADLRDVLESFARRAPLVAPNHRDSPSPSINQLVGRGARVAQATDFASLRPRAAAHRHGPRRQRRRGGARRSAHHAAGAAALARAGAVRGAAAVGGTDGANARRRGALDAW